MFTRLNIHVFWSIIALAIVISASLYLTRLANIHTAAGASVPTLVDPRESYLLTAVAQPTVNPTILAGPDKRYVLSPEPTRISQPSATTGPSPTPRGTEAGAGRIIESSQYPGSGVNIKNKWITYTNEGNIIIVYAGAQRYIQEEGRGDPNQGIIIVEVRQKGLYDTTKLVSHTEYTTPTKVGAVHITGATGMKLIVTPIQMTAARPTSFIFNVETGQFE